MKKIINILFLLLLGNNNVIGRDTLQIPAFLDFNSFEETSVNGMLNIAGNVFFLDTFNTPASGTAAFATSNKKAAKASGFFNITAQAINLSPNTAYIAGTSAAFSITVNYDITKIPFNVQELVLELIYAGKKTSLIMNIYFTPYNTVEVWNIHDFESLLRRWNYGDNNAVRIFVDNDSIPVSDLTPEEFANDDILKSWMSVDGLAYSVPVREVIDVYDSPVSVLGRKFPIIIQDLARDKGRDDCGKNRQRWVGKFNGNIQALVEHDIDGEALININGLKVEIWEKDGWPNPDDLIGIGFTNANGEYSIDVSTCQKFKGIWNEGSSLEVYMVLKGVNFNSTIFLKKRIGSTREISFHKDEVISWQYNNAVADTITENFELTGENGNNELKAQLLHWANLARNFVNREHRFVGFSLPQSNDPLVIKIHPLGDGWGGVFIPGGYRTIAAAALNTLFPLITSAVLFTHLSDYDGIYISPGSELDEDMLLHEFGHYAMWHLQGESWADAIEGGFADHSVLYNSNEIISWNEGWASFFGYIMDVVTSGYDNESGRDGGLNYELRRRNDGLRIEDIRRIVRDFNDPEDNPTEDYRVLTHGFVSEWNISCFLYDFWDGPANFNTYNITPFPPHRDIDDNGIAHDDFGFTFEVLTRPLRNNKGIGLFADADVISNVVQYFQALKPYLNCNNAQQANELTRINRIHYMDDDMNYPYTSLSVDNIANVMNVATKKFKSVDNPNYDFERKPDNVFEAFVDINAINANNESFNLARENSNKSFEQIIDTLSITSTGSLFINADLPIRNNAGNPHPLQGSHLEVALCSQNLRAGAGGRIILGENGVNTANLHINDRAYLAINNGGELTINPSCTLTVEDGGSLFLQSGSTLRIGGTSGTNAAVIVKKDGYICIEDGASIIFEGQGNSFLIRDGAIEEEINPVLIVRDNPSCTPLCNIVASNEMGNDFFAGNPVVTLSLPQAFCSGEDITLIPASLRNVVKYEWFICKKQHTGSCYDISTNSVSSGIIIPDGSIIPFTFKFDSVSLTNRYTIAIRAYNKCGEMIEQRQEIYTTSTFSLQAMVAPTISRNCRTPICANILNVPGITHNFEWFELNSSGVPISQFPSTQCINVRPRATTIYLLKVNDGRGCTNSRKFMVIVADDDCYCINVNGEEKFFCREIGGGGGGEQQSCAAPGNNNNNLIGSPNGHTFLQSAQLVNTEKVFEGDIHVAKNATLRIENSTIYMRECSRIVVEGRMEIINSQLKGCENARWKGVEVRGDKNKEQNFINQGSMLVESSIIADAEIGIVLGRRNGQTFDMNSGGGILEMSGGNVMERNRSNIKALLFEKPNHSIIEFTEFRELFKGGASPCALISAPRHIHIEKINGIKIQNNTFMGEDIGIHIQESKNFVIKENYFNETKVAVKTENSPLSDMGSDISNNHFIKSQNAIEFNNDDHTMLKVNCNEFWDYSDHGVLSINTQLADQGTLQKGAGNSYTSVSTQTNHSWAHQGNTMNYFHDPSMPINLITGNGYTANAVVAQQDNTCGAIAKTSTVYSTINSNEEIEDDELASAEDFGKYQLSIYPNPFNYQTNIIYTLIESQEVTLFITNIHGQVIDKLIDGKKQEAGCYKLTYDATHLAPGIYYYTLQAGGVYIETKKMGVLR